MEKFALNSRSFQNLSFNVDDFRFYSWRINNFSSSTADPPPPPPTTSHAVCFKSLLQTSSFFLTTGHSAWLPEILDYFYSLFCLWSLSNGVSRSVLTGSLFLFHLLQAIPTQSASNRPSAGGGYSCLLIPQRQI